VPAGATFVAYLLAGALGLLGIVFVVGSQGLPARLIVGVILLVAGGALVALPRLVPKQVTIKQTLDLTGDVSLQSMPCQSCGAAIGPENVQVKAGAVFVHCGHCGTSYQLEEAPKW
jgi:hypothetical protein